MANNIAKTSKIKLQVDNNVKDYGNQPFFIGKANQSKAFLDQYGFPKDLMKKKGISV